MFSWRSKWQPHSGILAWRFHGQRSLEGYSALDRKTVRHDLAIKQQQTLENMEKIILFMYLNQIYFFPERAKR